MGNVRQFFPSRLGPVGVTQFDTDRDSETILEEEYLVESEDEQKFTGISQQSSENIQDIAPKSSSPKSLPQNGQSGALLSASQNNPRNAEANQAESSHIDERGNQNQHSGLDPNVGEDRFGDSGAENREREGGRNEAQNIRRDFRNNTAAPSPPETSNLVLSPRSDSVTSLSRLDDSPRAMQSG